MARGALLRMADVIRAEVDDFLSKLEDPKKMVRQMILDMEDAFDAAVAAVGRSVANEKMLERQLAVKKEAAETWQKKAEAAIAAGDDATARHALFQKVGVDEAVDALEKALAEAREISQTLKQRLTELKAKLASAKSREGALALKKGVARSMSRESAGVMDSEAFARYDAYCREVARDEVTAQVYAEIAGEASPELDAAFGHLEQKQRVDAQIQALKAKVKGEQA